MASLPTPHDTLVRALLSDRERARDFLRDHLPDSVASLLDGALPEIVEGTFVDEALAGSRSDLLMRVGLTSGGSAFAYVLVEHKSAPDPGLPLQLASYMVRIWKRFASTSAARLRALPPIVPVVVYHGGADWTVPGSLRDMIAADDPDLVFLPGSGYILRNLRTMNIDALSRNAALRAGFIALRREALDFLAEISESLPEGSDLRGQILEYVLRVYDVDLDGLRTALRNGGHNELEAIMGTIAETLLEQGEARGLAKGEALGAEQGPSGGPRGREGGGPRGREGRDAAPAGPQKVRGRSARPRRHGAVRGRGDPRPLARRADRRRNPG